MSNVLVTGGAGFIGSHLVEKLLASGFKVFCLDNFNDFYEPQIKRDNIKQALNDYRDNLTILEGDIRDNRYLDKVFSSYKFDMVVHLAAMAGVRPSIKDPSLYNDVNLSGTLNLLECCRVNDIRKFVFASSSSVYGNNEKVPFSEEDVVDYPISPYAYTKKAGELLCHTYHHLHDFSISCLRFFTVYGPRQRPDLAIHKFSKLMLAGEPIPVFGDGTTKRDYTYIDDIIDGVMKAMDFTANGKVYEVFNLGESETISLSRMIETLEQALNVEAKIKRLPKQEGDVNQTYASISKSREVLGYRPSTDFDKGVRLFAEWLLKRES